MPKFLQFDAPTKLVHFPPRADGTKCCHEFDQHMKGAINAAIAANRPLLVRGEPGLGKSQLAEAAAQELERAFISVVIDSRTEHRDLLWRFDAVKRLAFAQMAPHRAQFRDEAILEAVLAESNFVQPGPLWWALNWESALNHPNESLTASIENSKATKPVFDNPLNFRKNKEYKSNGWVLLIDEIDKAESDVPNGLLEVLGTQQFTPYGTSIPVELKGESPLMLITTNEERSLPPAFIRRCVVLHLTLPETKDDLVELLVRRGSAHFGNDTDEKVLVDAATMLANERQDAERRRQKPLPGQAEFIDLMRAVINQHPENFQEQKNLLKDAAQFILKKHPNS